MNASRKLALVSPIKNELKNLPRLFASIEALNQPVGLWVLVDDHSTDGTDAFLLSNSPKLRCVERSAIVSPDGPPTGYELGAKYARVISRGFQSVREFEQQSNIDFAYIGILDADCFVHPDYYERLLDKFELLPRLGIASGVLYSMVNGERMVARNPRYWPRGGVRVWRSKCLSESGYFVVKSADAVSSASAWLNGWHCQSFSDSLAETREVGVRADPLYYGRSSYERYIPPLYVWLRFLRFLVSTNPQFALNFIRGYRQAKHDGARAPISPELERYFRLSFYHQTRQSLIAYRNARVVSRYHRNCPIAERSSSIPRL